MIRSTNIHMGMVAIMPILPIDPIKLSAQRTIRTVDRSAHPSLPYSGPASNTQEQTFFKVDSVAPAQWALGALLFGAGQVLNMSVYKALGTFGVWRAPTQRVCKNNDDDCHVMLTHLFVQSFAEAMHSVSFLHPSASNTNHAHHR